MADTVPRRWAIQDSSSFSRVTDRRRECSRPLSLLRTRRRPSPLLSLHPLSRPLPSSPPLQRRMPALLHDRLLRKRIRRTKRSSRPLPSSRKSLQSSRSRTESPHPRICPLHRPRNRDLTPIPVLPSPPRRSLLPLPSSRPLLPPPPLEMLRNETSRMYSN